jgi:putative ABC transport system permease protein
MILPINTVVAVQILTEKLQQRGVETPILVGQKGDDFDLTMNALYFKGEIGDPVSMTVYEQVNAMDAGVSVPLYIKHTASRTPIVGTNIDYLNARHLTIAQGRPFALLGEVIVGANVADDFQVQIGDTVRSDLQNLYNIAGAYPMNLKIVGILNSTGTVDDHGIFADVRTVWALDGLLHGHDKVNASNSLNANQDSENLEATAAIFMFPELNDDNRSTFHLHGDESEMPLSSVLVFPKNQQSHDILLGHFALAEQVQAMKPSQVVDDILDIVLQIQQGLTVYFVALFISTAAFFVLVIALSLQLRRTELELIRRIGGSKATIRNMIAAELSLVGVFALCTALGVSVVFIQVLDYFIQM